MMRAIRKRLGLGQVQVSKYLGLEQSAYSRVEGGTQKLTAEQWFLFCELTRTPPDAVFLGFVDYLRPIGQQENVFELPQNYFKSNGSSVRSIMPLVESARRYWGKKKWADYLDHVQVAPDFFLYLDNEINLNFEIDLIKALRRDGALGEKTTFETLRGADSPLFHGQLRFHYQNLLSPGERVKEWLSHQSHYETNFEYELIDEKPGAIKISVAADEKIQNFNYRTNPELEDFLCRYRKSVLKSFSQGFADLLTRNKQADSLLDEPRVQIRESQCHYKGVERCIYELVY